MFWLRTFGVTTTVAMIETKSGMIMTGIIFMATMTGMRCVLGITSITITYHRG